MTARWGVDSLQPINSTATPGGLQLGNYVINRQYAGRPHDHIVWWGRYFDHGYAGGNDHWRGDAEALALRAAVRAYKNPVGGSSWILPIAAPYPYPGPNSSYARGVGDGNYVGSIIAKSLSRSLHLPGNKRLMVFIDIEPAADFSLAWLKGWLHAVFSFRIGASTPLYAGAYVRRADRTTVRYLGELGYSQTWVYEPEPICAGCYSPGPAWAANSIGKPHTTVWQYGQANSYCTRCRGQTTFVDLDLTAPGITGTYGNGQVDNMLFIPA